MPVVLSGIATFRTGDGQRWAQRDAEKLDQRSHQRASDGQDRWDPDGLVHMWQMQEEELHLHTGLWLFIDSYFHTKNAYNSYFKTSSKDNYQYFDIFWEEISLKYNNAFLILADSS